MASVDRNVIERYTLRATIAYSVIVAMFVN